MKKFILLLILLLNINLYAAAAVMYVTQGGSGGSPNTGTGWSDAFSITEFETDAEGSAEAGDIYYIKGNLTLGSSFSSAQDGDAVTGPIRIIFVKSGTTNEPPVQSDYPTTTDRPTIAMGAYTWNFDNYWSCENGIFTTSGTGIDIDDHSKVVNCKVTSSGGSGTCCINIGNYSSVVDCEMTNPSGNCLTVGNSSRIRNCYMYNCVNGLDVGYYTTISKCIVSSASDTAISLGSNNNTVEDCIIWGDNKDTTIGIAGNSSYDALVYNTIIDQCATGIDWSSEQNGNYFGYILLGNNTTDSSAITLGFGCVNANPSFTDPSNGDFTYQSGSEGIDDGPVPPGATGDYNWNIGIDQDDNASGGGGQPFNQGFQN